MHIQLEDSPSHLGKQNRPDFSVNPGKLIKIGEIARFSANICGQLVIRKCWEASDMFTTLLAPEETVLWTAEQPGMYAAELVIGERTIKRSLAVVESDWAVCQITVGAFTAEDFAETIHGADLVANYYVNPERESRSVDFSLSDPRWLKYEREFGDEIYPHVMAKDVGILHPLLAHHDANWDSLPVEGIVERLAYLQKWWEEQGFRPLRQIATYTPCNDFVEACRQVGIRVIHSLIPEQNWSDGEWAINHWGMPTCPFWIAEDDFRKPAPKTPNGVLGMTMNHYQVLLPHLTKWGDFVLSPSHFTRWIRAADSGEESTRFKQFLGDILRGWKSLSGNPFFFVAGFEFGRTFGTANMTDYNRRGLEALIQLAATEKVVFSTGEDVRKYYERHIPNHPETAFRQRDSWIGCTVNGKPGQAGDSLVIERRDYKALVREGEFLPFFYYDYRIEWQFGTQDTDAPHDFAGSIREEMRVEVHDGVLNVAAGRPLERTVPVAVWDHEPSESPFPLIRMPLLDDGRMVAFLEVPAGWSGRANVTLNPIAAPETRRDDIWKMQSFGGGDELHTYLHLDAPLTQDVPVTVGLSKKVIVDGATGTLGELGPDQITLPFGPLNGWYRFWQCRVEDISPQENISLESALLPYDWPTEAARHQRELSERALRRIAPDERIVYQVFCGANLPLGTRSRAEDYDKVLRCETAINATEKADGVIAFGPGRSFWYHPRRLSIRITGLETGKKWGMLLHSFDPLGHDVKYQIFAGNRKVGHWNVPTSPSADEAFFKVDIEEGDVSSQGRLDLQIATDQQQILHWWKDRGFIAALHALWIVERRAN